MNKFTPFWILIYLECIWVLYYIGLIFAFQLGGSSSVSGIFYLRDALIKVAFHAAAPVGVLQLLEHPNHIPVASLFWIILALFTDIYSVLDVFLHLDHYVDPAAAFHYLNTLEALTLWAAIMSGLEVVWYLALLADQKWGIFGGCGKYESIPMKLRVRRSAAPSV